MGVLPSALCPRESEIARAQTVFFHTGDAFSKGINASCMRRPLAPEASILTARTQTVCVRSVCHNSVAWCAVYSVLWHTSG